MPTLTECCEQIGELVKEKDFRRDTLFNKLIWAAVEVSEAIDRIKKEGLPDLEFSDSEKSDHIDKLAIEMVDIVFYACDAYRLLKRRYPWLLSMDEMFDWKMNKNLDRPNRYGQQFIQEQLKMIIDQYAAEGLLPEVIDDFMTYTGTLMNNKPTQEICSSCEGSGVIRDMRISHTCLKCMGTGFTSSESKSAE